MSRCSTIYAVLRRSIQHWLFYEASKWYFILSVFKLFSPAVSDTLLTHRAVFRGHGSAGLLESSSVWTAMEIVLLCSFTSRRTQSPACTSRGCCSTAAACFQWELWLKVLTLISGSRWMWYQKGIAVILPACVTWTWRREMSRLLLWSYRFCFF